MSDICEGCLQPYFCREKGCIQPKAMSDTPRTDAFKKRCREEYPVTGDGRCLEFARQLERELAEEKERHERSDARWMEIGAKYERELAELREAYWSSDPTEHEKVIKAATIEECARVCDETAELQSEMAKEDGEMQTYRKARAWDASVCAAKIRALKDKP